MEVVSECIGAKTGKSEREKLTLYINAYMWNPKKKKCGTDVLMCKA